MYRLCELLSSVLLLKVLEWGEIQQKKLPALGSYWHPWSERLAFNGKGQECFLGHRKCYITVKAAMFALGDKSEDWKWTSVAFPCPRLYQQKRLSYQVLLFLFPSFCYFCCYSVSFVPKVLALLVSVACLPLQHKQNCLYFLGWQHLKFACLF